MDLDRVIIDRLIALAPGYVQSVLPFCQFSFVICQEQKTLKISCPNSYATVRINHAMFGKMGQQVNDLGIQSYLIDNGEGFISLHKFIRGNFLLVGLSNGNLEQFIAMP